MCGDVFGVVPPAVRRIRLWPWRQTTGPMKLTGTQANQPAETARFSQSPERVGGIVFWFFF
jgi:hypothetical protein